ncbi:DUF4391 domain-containing protein [Methanobrevibacter boviskoreani]|uniref:DUF4391 domain-containing protein n=1 Tax=Methanobrevibacter boviskoreani TaxID=1348249 RepID=UPI000594DB2A|nr:DUF4391 domain-containing protein [Methanobrevibacter boviskoreani]
MLLIEKLTDIPESALMNVVISKKDIFGACGLVKSDKEVFTKYVKQMKWIYKLDDGIIRLKPYHDDNRDYLEIEFININLKVENFHEIENDNEFNSFSLKEEGKINRIADIILRFIPYPIVLSFQYDDRYIRLFASHISDSLIDKDRITLDELISTNWIDTENMNTFSEDFFNNIKLDNLSFKNTYTFYDDIINAIIIYNGKINAGKDVSVSIERVNEINKEITKLNNEITDLKYKIKKESQFNKKVDLNMKINLLDDKVIKLKSELSK